MNERGKQEERKSPEEAGRLWVFRDEEPEDEEENVEVDPRAWLRLCRDFLKPHWYRFGLIALVLAVLCGSQYVTAYFQIIMVDRVLLVRPGHRAAEPPESAGERAVEPPGLIPAEEAAPKETRKRWLLYLLGGYLLMRFLIAASTMLRILLSISIGEKVVLKLRERIQEKLLELHLAYFEERQAGKIYSRILDDAGVIQQRIQTHFGTMMQNLFLVVFGIFMLFYVNWRLAVVVVLVLPLYVLNYQIFKGRMKYLFRRYRRRNSELYGIIADQLKGIRIMRLYCQQARELGHFVSSQNRVLRLLMGYNILHSGYSSISLVITGLGMAAVVAVGGLLVKGEKMSIGEFGFFYGTTAWLFPPFVMLSNIKVILDTINVTLSRIYEVLDTPTKIKDEPNAMNLKSIRGDVEMIDVGLRYEGKEDRALQHVNLRASAGTTVALVGPSGAGKSSLVKLLVRLYDPTEGTILIDGHNVKDIKLARLRKLVSIVLQEPKLFAGTIADNIKYGRDYASPSEVMQAAQLSDLHEFVMTLPEKYETVIGEEGVTLSGGQRQRLALAQAIITEPAILILDDSMSALDTVTESRITQSLQGLLASRTSFIITHRLITAMNADLIVCLDEGRIVETGTHEELIEKKGFYYDLFNQG